MSFIEPNYWNHQNEGFERSKDLPEFAYLFDVGTGKSLTLIRTLRYKYSRVGYLLGTLILSPAITLENWKNEWLQYSRIPEQNIIVLYGPIKKRLKILKEAVEKYHGRIIVITNYEGITEHKTNAATKELLEYILKVWQPPILACDESHRCANIKSSRTKSVIKISDSTFKQPNNFRALLTGTFVPNSPEDIWAQYRILDGGRSFGQNYYGFIGKYFYDINANNPHRPYKDWRPQPGALEKLREIVGRKAMRAKKEECIDLPELVSITVPVELTPSQRKLYDEMKTEMLTFIKDEAVVASMALTKTLRLMQIVSGFAKTESGECVPVENNREAVLEELLTDLRHEKVIVWAVFHENYAQIRRVCEKLKIQYREGHGLISTKDKFKEIEEFCTNPEIGVLIGNPGAIGIGINIKQAGTSIYFSRDYSFEKREQSEARNYRGGSINYHSKITRIDLVAKGTIDEIVMKALKDKLTTSEEILKLVKENL